MTDNSPLPPAPPRYVHGLFCEQVRDEVGGTQTYVGVYGRQVVLAFPPPALVTTLAAVTWIVSPIDDEIGKLSTRLHVPGGEVVDAVRDLPPLLPTTPEPRQRIAGLVLRANNLLIREAGRLWLEVIVDGKSWVGASVRFIAPQGGGTPLGTPHAS